MSEVLSPELIEAVIERAPDIESGEYIPEHETEVDGAELSPSLKIEEDEKPAPSPGLDLVLERHGGTEEDWKVTYQESGHRFDPVNHQLLDESGKSLTKEIETSSDNMSAEKIAEHHRMLDHFQSNPDQPYLLPDWVEQTKNGEVIHATVVTLDEHNVFHYETHSHEVEQAKPEEEDGEEIEGSQEPTEASILPSEERDIEAVSLDEVPASEDAPAQELDIPVLKIDLNKSILESLPIEIKNSAAVEDEEMTIAPEAFAVTEAALMETATPVTATQESTAVGEKTQISAVETTEIGSTPEVSAEPTIIEAEADRQVDPTPEAVTISHDVSEPISVDGIAKADVPPASVETEIRTVIQSAEVRPALQETKTADEKANELQGAEIEAAKPAADNEPVTVAAVKDLKESPVQTRASMDVEKAESAVIHETVTEAATQQKEDTIISVKDERSSDEKITPLIADEKIATLRTHESAEGAEITTTVDEVVSREAAVDAAPREATNSEEKTIVSETVSPIVKKTTPREAIAAATEGAVRSEQDSETLPENNIVTTAETGAVETAVEPTIVAAEIADRTEAVASQEMTAAPISGAARETAPDVQRGRETTESKSAVAPKEKAIPETTTVKILEAERAVTDASSRTAPIVREVKIHEPAADGKTTIEDTSQKAETIKTAAVEPTLVTIEEADGTESAATQGMTGKEILLRSLGIVPERRNAGASARTSEALDPFGATMRSGASSVQTGANPSAAGQEQQHRQQQKNNSGTSLNGITLRRAA